MASVGVGLLGVVLLPIGTCLSSSNLLVESEGFFPFVTGWVEVSALGVSAWVTEWSIHRGISKEAQRNYST